MQLQCTIGLTSEAGAKHATSAITEAPTAQAPVVRSIMSLVWSLEFLTQLVRAFERRC